MSYRPCKTPVNKLRPQIGFGQALALAWAFGYTFSFRNLATHVFIPYKTRVAKPRPQVGLGQAPTLAWAKPLLTLFSYNFTALLAGSPPSLAGARFLPHFSPRPHLPLPCAALSPAGCS